VSTEPTPGTPRPTPADDVAPTTEFRPVGFEAPAPGPQAGGAVPGSSPTAAVPPTGDPVPGDAVPPAGSALPPGGGLPPQGDDDAPTNQAKNLWGLVPEDRPEVLLGVALAGGVLAAIILRSLVRR
jgi:hypothetical protein